MINNAPIFIFIPRFTSRKWYPLTIGLLIDGKKQLCQSCKVPLRRRSIPIFFRYWRMCILNVKRNVCALFVLRRPIIFCLIFRSSSQQENNNLLQLNTHDNRTCCDLIKNYIYNSGFINIVFVADVMTSICEKRFIMSRVTLNITLFRVFLTTRQQHGRSSWKWWMVEIKND